jgi:hypothetical protein
MTAPRPDLDPMDAGCEDDRCWFEAHPRRQYRIRPYLPGDGLVDYRPADLQPGRCRLTVVRQIQPGERVRLVFWGALPLPTGEQVAMRIFQVVMRKSGDVVNGHGRNARARTPEGGTQ